MLNQNWNTIKDADLIAKDTHAYLQAQGIVTIGDVFSAFNDDSTTTGTIKHLTAVIARLSFDADISPVEATLIDLLPILEPDVQQDICQALGNFGTADAIAALIDLLQDDTQDNGVRVSIPPLFASISEPAVTKALIEIILDEDEDVEIRNTAIEWVDLPDKFMLPLALQLLQHRLPDIRFWAAYRLSNLSVDISEARTILADIVAEDQTLPRTWGWHVDREATLALEKIDNRPYGNVVIEDGEVVRSTSAWVLSPAAEFMTFVTRYRRFKTVSEYTNLREPENTLQITPGRIIEAFEIAGVPVQFDVRPEPRAYLLDWMVESDGAVMLGGLMTDGYGIVLSGNPHLVHYFAIWFAENVVPETRLYLYEWGDGARAVTAGMAVEELMQMDVDYGRE